ncbi:MAG: hypothetical protein ABFE08_10520 [Armatimonadia bacterium]
MPTIRHHNSGAALISVLTALGFTLLAGTMLAQAYLQLSHTLDAQTVRTRALAMAQEQIELTRARGYSALPAVGNHALPPRGGLSRWTIVALGPVPDSRTVTAWVSWPPGDGRPAGRVVLTTILARRGMAP